MISQKPYLIRAIYQWCIDNNLIPYLMAHVDTATVVPPQYQNKSEIILNISESTITDLNIDNISIHFNTKFNGNTYAIYIPIGNILGIFDKETGHGMQFELETTTDTIISHLQLVK